MSLGSTVSPSSAKMIEFHIMCNIFENVMQKSTGFCSWRNLVSRLDSAARTDPNFGAYFRSFHIFLYNIAYNIIFVKNTPAAASLDLPWTDGDFAHARRDCGLARPFSAPHAVKIQSKRSRPVYDIFFHFIF